MAHQSADGHSAWYVKVLDGLHRHLGALYGYELGDVGMGGGEEFDVMDIDVEHHLIDM